MSRTPSTASSYGRRKLSGQDITRSIMRSEMHRTTIFNYENVIRFDIYKLRTEVRGFQKYFWDQRGSCHEKSRNALK